MTWRKKLRDRLREITYSVATGRASSKPERRIKLRPDEVQRVVILRYDAIGDYIVTTPLIAWLKKYVPGVEIDVIGSTRNKSLIELDPNIQRAMFIEAKHSPKASWLDVRRFMLGRNYDVVFATVVERMTKALIMSLFAGRAARRVAVEHVQRRKTYAEAFDFLIKHDQPLMHWIDTFKHAGPSVIDAPFDDTLGPYITITDEARRAVQHLSDAPYIVANISAQQQVKRWNVAAVVQCIREVIDLQKEFDVLVMCGPDDIEEAQAIINNVNSFRCRVVQRSLPEACAVIERARMLISPDTAAIHIASACGVPTVGLYLEQSNVIEWGPYRTPAKIILSSDGKTNNAIDPLLVAQTAVALLNELVAIPV